VNYSGNISGVDISNIFGKTIHLRVFDYSNDYHYKSTCPGKGAGTDGTDLGYNMHSFTHTAVPVIPHLPHLRFGRTH